MNTANQNGTASPLSSVEMVRDTEIVDCSLRGVNPVASFELTTESASMQTVHLDESALESASPITDSSSASASDFIDLYTVKPSVSFVRQCLCRLALVFEPNSKHFSKGIDSASEVYANLLGGYSDAEVGQAFMACAKTLTRFPFPVDVIESIRSNQPAANHE